MAHINRVLRSIETDDGGRCVDLFVRSDGSFGFEEYRRDSEDRRGWFPIGGYAAAIYTTEVATLAQALLCVPWLCHSMGGR
jgi:hypothetical protein